MPLAPGGSIKSLGRVVVALAGTPIVITANYPAEDTLAVTNPTDSATWMNIQADPNNTGGKFIYVLTRCSTMAAGGVGMLAALLPGQSFNMAMYAAKNWLRLEDIYLDADVTGMAAYCSYAQF